MKELFSKKKDQTVTIKKKKRFSAFYLMLGIMALAIAGTVFFLTQYHSVPSTPSQQITFEQKMAHLQTGTPLPSQGSSQAIPLWIIVLVLGFLMIQVLPLLVASYKANALKLTQRDVREIEFLAETPMFLGLLGSLVGVCMTQFISGTLAAPLAYLTTISGILLYLLGRFTILVSLPSSNDLS